MSARLRLTWIGVLGFLGATVLVMLVANVLAHVTTVIWLPAYVGHAILLLSALLILIIARIARPSITVLPTGKWLFSLIALFFAVAIVWRSPTALGPVWWLSDGWFPATMWILFQGVVVGWTEEYMFRGALQRLFGRVFPGRKFLGISAGIWIANIAFAAFHLGDVTYQSWGSTLSQVIYALAFGLLLGWYYERTEDFTGVAWLHNIIDLAILLAPLIR